MTTGAKTDDLDEWWRSVAEYSERIDKTLAAAGRDPAGLGRYLSLDSAPAFSLSSPSFFVDAVGRAAQLGFTDVITHWPRRSSWYAGDESVLETVATEVLPQIRAAAGPH